MPDEEWEGGRSQGEGHGTNWDAIEHGETSGEVTQEGEIPRAYVNSNDIGRVRTTGRTRYCSANEQDRNRLTTKRKSVITDPCC